MKISHINSLAFTSIPLYDVKLKKQNPDGTTSEIPAKFSKLDNQDKSDIKEAKRIMSHWPSAGFAHSAARHFIFSAEADKPGQYDYYVVENIDETKGFRNIFSIAEYDKMSRRVELLQANPQNCNGGVKGSGEVILYGIAKHNKPKVDNINFDLLSSEGGANFYKKIGLDGFYRLFELRTDKTDEFLDRIEKKYHFDGKA